MGNQTTIGNTRELEALRVIADITTKLANGSLTLESAKSFAKKENPFALPQKLTVNGKDSRFQTINPDEYNRVDPNLRIEHCPIFSPSIREVKFDLSNPFEFGLDASTWQIMSWQNEPGFRPLERDEAETFLDNVQETHDQIRKSAIVCICGTQSEGKVGIVCIDHTGRSLLHRDGGFGWNPRCRFVRACKE